MEQEDFPGWGKMIICVLSAVVPAAILNAALPPQLFIVGLAVGAVCAAIAISMTCGMSVKRSAIAASISLGFQVALSLVFRVLFRS